MAVQEDIDRARDGKKDWNDWAKKELEKPREQRATVDFSDASISPDIDFSGFVFPGDANFHGAMFSFEANFEGATFSFEANFKDATFVEWADFQGATFKSQVIFEGATFKKRATFIDATFESLTGFEGATFEQWAYFKGATFKGETRFKGTKFERLKGSSIKSRAIFNNATFKDWTDFTGATFQSAPCFHKADIHQDTAFSPVEDFPNQFPDIESKDAEGRGDAERAYRTLKLAMNKYQSHTEEAGFFKLELMARAKKEKWYRKWMYRAYGLFSDYGQGILRPFICWAVLALVMFFLYACILGNLGESFTVTLAQALPLIGVEKEALKEALNALFPPDGNAPIWFQISRALHMVASSFFIFLALLALRNRFKIK